MLDVPCSRISIHSGEDTWTPLGVVVVVVFESDGNILVKLSFELKGSNQKKRTSQIHVHGTSMSNCSVSLLACYLLKHVAYVEKLSKFIMQGEFTVVFYPRAVLLDMEIRLFQDNESRIVHNPEEVVCEKETVLIENEEEDATNVESECDCVPKQMTKGVNKNQCVWYLKVIILCGTRLKVVCSHAASDLSSCWNVGGGGWGAKQFSGQWTLTLPGMR